MHRVRRIAAGCTAVALAVAGLAWSTTQGAPGRHSGVEAGAATPSASAQAGQPAGFSPGFSIIDQPPAALGRDLRAMRGLGGDWIRIDVSWARAEPRRGRFDWADTDRVIAAARARGLSVLAVIGYEPQWARTYRDDGSQRPVDPAGFARFAAAAARRYTTDIRAWEVWNEPNTLRFWKPRPSPLAYSRLLRAAAEEIRANDPGDPILVGGLAPATDAADGSGISPLTFLRDLYASGARRAFDAVAVHPYSYPAMPTDPHWWNTFYRLPDMNALMASRGDAGKKLWLTEYGAPTGSSSRAVSQQRQSDMIVEAYDEASRLGFVGPIFFYAYRDAGTNAGDPEQNFGVVRKDGTTKLAFTALRRALQD